jgi:hypothetical protein
MQQIGGCRLTFFANSTELIIKMENPGNRARSNLSVIVARTLPNIAMATIFSKPTRVHREIKLVDTLEALRQFFWKKIAQKIDRVHELQFRNLRNLNEFSLIHP